MEQDLGVSLRKMKMAFFSDYPVELQIAVEERVCKVLWNEDYDTAVYKIGRINFESFSKSAIGRTSLAMLGKDPKRLLKATARLMKTVVSGMVLDVEERGETAYSLRFRNSPHRPLGWKGTIDAALDQAGVKADVEIINRGLNDNEFLVSWG